MDRHTRVLGWFVGVGLIFAAAYLLYMRWEEGRDSWIGQAETWMIAHIQTVELVAVWALALSFAVLGGVKLASWWALRGSRDRTAVGRTLKTQKAAEAVATIAMGGYWSLLLAAYYGDLTFGIWARYGVIAVVVIATMVSAATGVRFVMALRDTRNGGPGPPDPPGTMSDPDAPPKSRKIYWFH